jgi:cell wall-associated NlpC family hydrolase
VAIYGGEGRFIHAPGTGKLVQWGNLDDPYFKARYIGALSNLFNK